MNPIIRGLNLARGTRSVPTNRASRREQQRAENRVQRQQRRQAQRTGQPTQSQVAQQQRDAFSQHVTQAQTKRETAQALAAEQQQKARDLDAQRGAEIHEVQRVSKARRINNSSKEDRKRILENFSRRDWEVFVREYEERWERWDSRNEMEPMGSPEEVENFVDSF